MMMDDATMGGYMAWMVIVVLVIATASVGLAWLLLRPPRTESIEAFNRSYRASDSIGANAGDSHHPIPVEPAIEEKLLIVIPDISGYTRFITKSRFALAHAHFVIQELLDSIMISGSDYFTPMRIEGDAVVFYADSREADPHAIGDTIVSILEAFYRKRAQLKHDNVCRCSFCENIAELDLKIILHEGNVLRFHMKEFEDATGEAMIDAHRLLKGVSVSHRYILVSDDAFSNIQLSNDWSWTDFAQERHESGPMRCHLTLVPDEMVNRWDQIGRSPRAISDLVRKLAALRKINVAKS